MRYILLEIRRFLDEEDGVSSIEYVMLASLIAVVILGAVSALGAQVCSRYIMVASALGATGMTCD